MQVLLVFTHNWKELNIDFVIRIPKSKNWPGVEYEPNLVIVDQLKKTVNYEPVFTTLEAELLPDLLIEAFIKSHSLSDSIVTDQGSLFTSKFWSSLCHYFNIKRQFSTTF